MYINKQRKHQVAGGKAYQSSRVPDVLAGALLMLDTASTGA